MQHHRRQSRPHRRRFRPRQSADPLFYRSLARFVGYCRICNTSFKVGDPIYDCRRTRTTRAMRCHASCYLQMIGTLPAPRRSDAATSGTVNPGTSTPTTGQTAHD